MIAVNIYQYLFLYLFICVFFFFQAEDGIRDVAVTGVQTCGLPISLASEHLLLKKELTRSEINRLARIDAVYGVAALVLLTAGLILWLGSVGKPAVYYTKKDRKSVV